MDEVLTVVVYMYTCKRVYNVYILTLILKIQLLATDSGLAEIRLRFSSEQAGDTKSTVFSESDFAALKNVVVYGVDESNGMWKRVALTASGGTASTSMSFMTGRDVTFYVLGNMGQDIELPANSQGRLVPQDFVFMLPETPASLKTSGVPMAKKVSVSASQFPSAGEYPLEVKLERLMAKVTVTINKSAITGGVDTPVLASDHIAIRQANRRLRPFHPDGSKALSSADLFSGTLFDYESLSDNDDIMESGIVLYIPENCQGQLSGGDWSTDTPSDLSGQGALCTYIEYLGSKDGTQDGVGGDVYYRGFLGGSSSNHSLFSVERNKAYTASLSLTWDGLIWNADGWRIDADDVTDGRRIILSSSNDSSTPVSGNSLGKIKREASKQVYVNFSRDGGSTWIHGVKDIADWPYGWDFYIDGVKQSTGAGGTASGLIAWAYAGSSSSDMLTVTPGAMSTLGSSHTLQVKSKDGSVVSNVVSFEIGVPITLIWRSSIVPGYVAQRGELVPQDMENPSAEVVYSVTSGNGSNIRFTSTGNSQTKYVGLLKPGTVTIHAACAATGQEGDIEVTIAAPEMAFDYTAFYANPDGAEARTGTTGLSGSYPAPYYHVPGETQVLSRSASSAVGVMAGNYFAQDLYDELLAFTPTIADNLGFLSTSSEYGYGDISVRVITLTSPIINYPTANAGTDIGTLTVSPKVATTGVTPATAAILSVNPFSAYPSSVSLDTTKDIHDFSVIGFSPFLAWGGGYSETTYTTSFPTTRAGNAYVGLEAYMNGYYEPKLTHVFSGTPGATVSWSSITQARDNEHTAGVVSLKASVKNRYSQELVYSPVFYQCRLFRHGAVEAFMWPEDHYSGIAYTAEVSARYYLDYYYSLNRADFYPSDGLGCAFPDVGTHRTDETIDIAWSNYESHMEKYDGSLTIDVNPDPRPVRAPETDYLYTIRDDCAYSHYWLDVTECHEGMSGNLSGIYFCTANKDNKYEKGYIKRINENLVYLHPDGAPTTTVSGYTVGYFVLHTYNYVADYWL